MSEPLLFHRQQRWMQGLLQLVQFRNDTEVAIEEKYHSTRSEAATKLQTLRQMLSVRKEKEFAAADAKLNREYAAIEEQHTVGLQANDKELGETRLKVQQNSDEAEEKARSGLHDSIWKATTYFEDGEKDARDDLQKGNNAARAGGEAAEGTWRQLEAYLMRCNLEPADVIPVAVTHPQPTDPGQTMHNALKTADMFLSRLQNLLVPKLLSAPAAAALLLLLIGLCCLPAIWFGPWILWVIGGVFVGVLLFLAVRAILKAISVRQIRKTTLQLARSLEVAEDAQRRLLDKTKATFEAKMTELTETHERKKRQAESKYLPLIEQIEEKRSFLLQEAGNRHKANNDSLEKKRDGERKAAEYRHAAGRTEAESKHDRELGQGEADHNERMRKLEQEYQSSWQALVKHWDTTLQGLRDESIALRTENDRLFPAWDSPAWQDRPTVTAVPRGVRLGEFAYDIAKIPGGVPTDKRLKLEQPLRGNLPAFLPFPERCALLLQTRDQTRAPAVQLLQGLMMRLLTSVPPGKVRFTIIDPVGLGDNFATFMHLSDYAEALIGGRIWTEPQQIEQRLTDLTTHMENVIQKYLRHQYKSIEDYNAAAGEVAEPFRVVVIANFPANFSSDAARRLVSIVNSGASCGVYALISADMKLPLPHTFNFSDLEQACMNMVWKNDRFIFPEDVLSKYDLTTDAPPPSETASRLVHVIGAQAKLAARVEVPFDFVAPKPDQVWRSDSRQGISVPIGRAGATKAQVLQLGRGTAQHGLIAGKTGSGKSTLLHAIITNMAMHYSPDEIELYLIDFKKGVEFKPYAEHMLPHARVVAIESEREFGLSVLQRLDAELRIRGDKFRTAGVNDVNSFRNERPNEKLPRILLIVDEFQEFFTEDDKLAQEAALLLDRLVRQGRAFGLHVLLGSQTLGGAYSLARATIDQMAVRIALQCSEADAHLILSKDNSAARLLGRPGEAIYNDANGLLEGNDLFQVVWLSDERKESTLADLQARPRDASIPPPLIFEGNAPAEPHRNHLLDQMLRADGWPAQQRAFTAWLGEAIAIKDPTAAVFRPQSGSHLLMIGQFEEAALAMLSTSILGLCAQHRPEESIHPQSARFTILDGTTVDDPNVDYLRQLVDGLPHPVQIADSWSMANLLTELAELVNQRHQRATQDRSTRYLVIQGLQRFRDLRRPDDDFGFRRGDKAASPAENFATILRDGPMVGVHLLMWCDTLINVNRTLDRPMLRECTQRVLFQMSATDSSHLMDTPLAARLGRNRALFHREEQEQPEKFRPYGMPNPEWVRWVKERLKERAAAPVPASAAG
ncbi:MAG TPA: FtsK/SpoIIIE domain-containing protein [Gemmataceae bacterium]|nr:FtsK/SpoIIIE domain-containing protein [Gemmataceae bacterium]